MVQQRIQRELGMAREPDGRELVWGHGSGSDSFESATAANLEHVSTPPEVCQGLQPEEAAIQLLQR